MTKDIIIKLIQERCSEEEKSQILQWVVSQDFEKDLDKFIQKDLSTELTADQYSGNTDLNHLVDEIIFKAKNINPQQIQPIAIQHEIEHKFEQKNKRKWIINIAKIAAAIVLIASFIFIINYFFSNKNEPQLAVNTIVKENLRGRKSTIFLKDGSIIYLNSNSKIKYPEVFNDSARVVYLEGEAYFDVVKNEHKPFIVQIGALQIKVLGTSFNIRAFVELEDIKVSLNSGLVEVSNIQNNLAGQKVKLNPGQSVSYMKKTDRFAEVAVFDPHLDLTWKEGNLVFRDADINDVIHKLERWYGVDFSLENKPNFKWGYTGSFKNQTLHDVLVSLSFSQDFDFKINKNQIIVKFISN